MKKSTYNFMMSLFNMNWRATWRIASVFCALFSAMTVSAISVESLENEDRVLNEAVELHITSSDTPFINATVSLDHEDAWVFFDNIKPSELIANYLGNVKVSGAAFNNGGNGRVAIYKHGAVLMPYSNSFKPLTVYSGENFSGDSSKMSIHTFYRSLGNLDNAIKSFKLKRGYMATFANNSDGSGYSRVFIADNEDIKMPIMPVYLHGNVSFIRVFKHQWVTKKGKAGWDPHQLDATTYYDWNIGGNSSADAEYVAIRQKSNWPGWTDINSKQNISHLLGFNEPNQADQADMTVDECIAQWPDFMASGLRVGSPAPNDGGRDWLLDFMNKADARGYRVDFVAVHFYRGGQNAGNFYNYLKDIHDQTGRPIWVTEWNNGANWTNEWWPSGNRKITDDNAQEQLKDIEEFVNMLDTASFVERYFIYDWVEDCRAMIRTIDSSFCARNPDWENYEWLKDAPVIATSEGKKPDGTTGTVDVVLTPAGEYYTANKSIIAYNSDSEVIPEWDNFESPTLSYRHLPNTIKLSWEDQNGEMARMYEIEKKVHGGTYETIYESADLSVLTYNDPLDANISGRVDYRMSVKTVTGSYLRSNEVSYYQAEGGDALQVANLEMSGDDWKTCLFSTVFDEKPKIILGMPEYNNTAVLTTRANNISKESFKLTLSPWLYLNNPTLSRDENISILALPGGTYDFGGLKGEVAEVTGVSRDWVSITFAEAFDEAPIVIATQVSNLNSYPTTPVVRNVTATGFEICIKTEEAVTGFVPGEKIHYLAVEEGRGVIEGKRITVGQTADGNGLKTTPRLVQYDESYTAPAFFGGLMSEANTFASTLRFFHSGSNGVRFVKQRETSETGGTVNEDKLGWMIMDLAPNQDVSAVDATSEGQHGIYPNPVLDMLYFEIEKPVKVSIYNLAGKLLIDQLSLGKVDVSTLPSGLYMCKIGNKDLAKFVKK